MTINLNVLIDAVKALEMLRQVADPRLSTEQFMQALRAYSALDAWVKTATKEIEVEVA